jgi:Na+/H+-dicarboxylate symporter
MPHKHAQILLIFIVIGVIAGLFTGWLFGESMQSVTWLGKLFLTTLKMLIVPLIVSAIVTGVSSLGDVRKLGRIGSLTIGYYFITTGIAVFIGLILVNIIQPGQGLEFTSAAVPERITEKEAVGFVQIIESLISPNLVKSAAETDLLPIIIFSIVFAAALTTLGSKGERVIEFFSTVNEVMMKLVIWVMYFAPVGIFALVASRLGEAGGGEAFWLELQAVGLYVLTVLSGLAVHIMVLGLILLFVAKRGFSYFMNVTRALFTAFGTASSTATLPLTMECVRENGVDDRAVEFTLPLGSTVNMDGTALYEAAAVMFIAQAYGIDMSATEQVIIFITATLAAIGAAGIPEAGLVTMVIVLNAVNLPLEGIGLILAVDWFLDRFRTATNVWGDTVGAAVVDRFLVKSS